MPHDNATPASPALPTLAPKSATAPRTFAIDPSIVGVVAALVLFSRPRTKHAPDVIRDTFEAAILDAAPVAAADKKAADAFLGTLPERVTPVAALGLAVREAVDGDHRWQHVRQIDGGSRWIYCAARVSDATVDIHGSHGAECYRDGRLEIDSDVPPTVAARLRAAYDAARGVVDPSRVTALVSAYLAKRGARAITSDTYLIPDVDPTTCGVLAGLVRLGGWAETLPVADAARIARLTSPVTESIEEQIARVVEKTQEFIAQAAAVTSTDGERLQERTIDGVRAKIAEARAAAELWRDRLKLASLDVGAQLDALTDAAERADDEAQAAQRARREARKAAKAANGGAQ